MMGKRLMSEEAYYARVDAQRKVQDAIRRTRNASLPHATAATKARARRKPSNAGTAKYRAVPTVVDGIRFASKKEARVYAELKLREKAGEIADLKLQPVCNLSANGVKICKYVGDFLYFDRKLDPPRMVWLDAKGMKTPIYRLKKKLVLALTGIEITEV